MIQKKKLKILFSTIYLKIIEIDKIFFYLNNYKKRIKEKYRIYNIRFDVSTSYNKCIFLHFKIHYKKYKQIICKQN